MKRLAFALLALLSASSEAAAQSSPNFSYGQVPTAKQWNDAFSSKQDRLTFAPLNPAGGTMQGKLQTAPSTVNAAGLALLPGTAPSAPSNGDLWATTVGLYGRFGGRTLALPGLDQATGALLVPNGPTLGTYQNGQFTSQPYKIQIQGPGSTGPVDGTTATATGAGASRTLADAFAFAAGTTSTVSTLRALAVNPLVPGLVASVSGYYSPADGGGGVFTWSPTSIATDDSCSVIQPTAVTGAGRWLRDVVKAGVVNARSCGVAADALPDGSSGTNDTAALQRTINLCKGRGGEGKPVCTVQLPPGVILHTGEIIDRGLTLRGDPRGTTLLAQRGLTGPGLTLSCAYDTQNYYALGAPPCRIKISDLIVRHVDRTDAPGQNVAHAISIQNAATNPVYTTVQLDNIEVFQAPGDGINAVGFTGIGLINNLYVSSSFRDNVSLNSIYDWRISNWDLIYAGRDNLALSAVGGLKTFGINSYNAGRYGILIYGPNGAPGVNYFYGTETDSNGQAGLYYDERDPSAVNTFAGGNFAQNSQSAAGTYPDVLVTATANSQLRFTAGWRFNTPNGNFSIQFAGTGNTVQANDIVVQAGAPTVANKFSNAPIQVLMAGQPWTTYTPTVTGGTGATFGAVVGYVNRNGKTTQYRLVIPQTASGTGAGSVTASLPCTASNAGGYSYGFGREINATNAALVGQIAPNATTVAITTSTVGYPGGSGYQLTLSGTYECQ